MGTRRGGPRTKRGRKISSMNSTKFGLLGKFNVTGDESAHDYAEAASRFLMAFGPATDVERRLCLVAADILWRLERLLRIEHRHHHVQLELAMRKTREFRTQGQAQAALVAVQEMGKILASSTPVSSGPAVQAFAVLAHQVEGLVRAIEDLPLRCVKAFERAVRAVDLPAQATVQPEALQALRESVREVARALSRLVKAGARDLRKVQRMVEATTLLVDDAQAKRLNRYSGQLQKGLKTQLDLITSVKALVSNPNSGGSFGKAISHPLEVKVVGRLAHLPEREGSPAVAVRVEKQRLTGNKLQNRKEL
jgi:methyl-accepting chemotaxis protein